MRPLPILVPSRRSRLCHQHKSTANSTNVYSVVNKSTSLRTSPKHILTYDYINNLTFQTYVILTCSPIKCQLHTKNSQYALICIIYYLFHKLLTTTTGLLTYHVHVKKNTQN